MNYPAKLSPKLGIIAVGLIFSICILITFSSVYKRHPETLSTALIIDLAITAPLLWLLLTRKTGISKWSTIRIFVLGIALAGMILTKGNNPLLHALKTWIGPAFEALLIGVLIRKFYVANKLQKSTILPSSDFLCHFRIFLKNLLGNELFANVLASEISVFYYAFFCRKPGKEDSEIRFTSYKESGILFILWIILGLLLIEATSMHLLFLLWNKTIAVVLTTLSLYTCLQLYAHIKAIKRRPSTVSGNLLLLKNGLWGGETIIDISNIQKVECSAQRVKNQESIKLSFLKNLDNHNLVIYLNEPVQVIGAFGFVKTARVILLYVDDLKTMKALIEEKRTEISKLNADSNTFLLPDNQ